MDNKKQWTYASPFQGRKEGLIKESETLHGILLTCFPENREYFERQLHAVEFALKAYAN